MLQVQNLGPIGKADVRWGDLTILIGPQAMGKSLLLELFKLLKDGRQIVNTLREYNYMLSEGNTGALCRYYFGDGMEQIVRKDMRIGSEDGNEVLARLTTRDEETTREKESVFYVPAQRILALADGRPKNFMEFDYTTPYVLRRFSETLRLFLQHGIESSELIYPLSNRLSGEVLEALDHNLFHGAKVVTDVSEGQRKMKLDIPNGLRLPFMAWSAGQKEFMPLLLSLYCLTDNASASLTQADYKWVIIEEPEMGLHPQAVQTVILQIVELIQMGYKVIVSTHSTTLLEFAWVMQSLRHLPANKLHTALCELFNVSPSSGLAMKWQGIETKEIRSYFFHNDDQGRVQTTDISSLDVGSQSTMEAEWGNLASFAGRAAETVSKYYDNEEG